MWVPACGRRFGLLALAVAVAASCSAGQDSDPPSAGSGANGSGANGSGGIDIGGGGEGASQSSRGGNIGVGNGTGDAGELGFGGACAGEVTKGELVPLDVHIMLDTSGSMLLPTGPGMHNWQAVKDAIEAFLLDEGSDGIGVGIQYFPLPAPGIPETCTMDDECGAAGPCWTAVCAGDTGLRCTSDQSCDPPGPFNDYGPCVGTVCSENAYFLCLTDDHCVDEYGNDHGSCVPQVGHCQASAACDPADYSTPAVTIDVLPGAAEGILDSINSVEPVGNTPTAAALGGALTYAGQWAADHPDHTVVTLFATDGLPTQCLPQDFPTIAAIAGDARAATPSVSTYVVGVFPPDVPDVQASLDLIAAEGGTEQAFMVDTSQDVAAQFLAALNAIRGSKLACEFQVPEAPAGEELDYDGKVNVQFSLDGATEVLPYVASADNCGVTQGGWYYDVDPADGDVPTKILVCPSTCTAFQESTGGEVEIELGCETETTVIK